MRRPFVLSGEQTDLAFRRHGLVAPHAVVLTAALLLPSGCDSSSKEQQPVEFEDASDELSSFKHLSLGFGGDALSGAGWLDYDDDGDLDLYLTNGKHNDNALFRNNGDGTFTDVAEEAGVANGRGNVAIAVGDIDNDGYPDMYLSDDGEIFGKDSCVLVECQDVDVAAEAPPVLYHNNGDGTFTDIAESAGLTGEARAISGLSSAFGDINNDGYLDLFVTAAGDLLNAVPYENKLYINNGDLTFTDISASAGVNTSNGACAAGFIDHDGDEWLDLLVGNCNRFEGRLENIPGPWELYRNNGDETFTDITEEAGDIAELGLWMSVTPFDYDNNGTMDIFATSGGTNNGFRPRFPSKLYRNNGDGTYTDVTEEAGAVAPEHGWGATATDFNNDGYQDLFYTGSNPFPPFGAIGPAGNPGRMFVNNGDGTFTDVTDTMPMDQSPFFTSAAARADYDNDGYVDIAISLTTFDIERTFTDPVDPDNPMSPFLLRNKGGDNNWLTVRVIGTSMNRDGIGSRIEVVTKKHTMSHWRYAGTSFNSAETPWLTFGLATQKKAEVRVHWLDGGSESFGDFDANQMVTVTQGEGQPL